jgi:hypothetical protein
MISPALAIGAIGAQAIGNAVGAMGEARSVYSPELEQRAQQISALEDEQARQFMQEQRAAQAGQQLDVESAALRQGAAMAQQGAFSGREMQEAALALQMQRRQQAAELAVIQAREQMQRLQRQAERGLELQSREDAARGVRLRGLAGALGQAGVQGIGVGSQIAAMRAQQSFQQQLLNALTENRASQAARAAAGQTVGRAAQGAFQPEEDLSFAEVPFEMQDAVVDPEELASAYIPGVDYR